MGKGKQAKLEVKDGIVGKYCTKCEDWKPLDGFVKRKGGLCNRRAACKICESKIKRDNYQENREHIIKYNKQWYETNRERLAEHFAEYRRNYHQKNKEHASKIARDWAQANRDRIILIGQRRKARKANLPDYFPPEHAKRTLSEFNGCALTECKDFHWDHVIPLAVQRGGTIFGNMIPLRADLNTSKKALNLFEWFAANRQRFELSQSKFDKLIQWLSSANDMTVEEYRDYVYWCHANPGSTEDVLDNIN